jgi:YidC/Oxa1 family membrane protein insertase
MERRVIVFLVLSLIIISAYPLFQDKFAPQGTLPPQGTLSPQMAEKPPLQKDVVPSKPATGMPPAGADNPAGGRAATLPQATIPQKAIAFKVIEGDLYRVVLSSRGGTIKEWTLKKYKAKNADGVETPIQLIQKSGKVAPLSVTISGDDLFANQTYSLDETKIQLSPSNPTETVIMKAVDAGGRTITKEITFHNDQYQADIRIRSELLKEGYSLSLGSNFGITNWEQSFGGAIGAVSMVDGKIVSDDPEMTTLTHDAGVTWFGLMDKYYMSALMPVSDGGVAVAVRGISEKEVAASVKVSGTSAREQKFILYAGPKEYDRLASYHKYLEEAIDFGWFIFGSLLPVRLVAKPLFYVLRFTYSVTQNYGIAIILLTIFVKLLFHPITKKSLVSMKAMASLQPKVTAIREKWSDNKEKMNKELMNLYKETGVNPFGGCLPMLLQMPVFVALFNVLYVTIDLKGAPFMLWISDLSDKDPYYVLPIIMGATMVIQQMTQPNAMDPTQAKIMMFMPVIYTFFFLSFPSGLVLYWLINNLLSIAQQYWINKQTTVAT